MIATGRYSHRSGLIDDPAYAEPIKTLQAKLVAQMKKTEDPMLPAFLSRNDRAKVDEILVATYGPKKDERPKAKKDKSKKRKKKNSAASEKQAKSEAVR